MLEEPVIPMLKMKSHKTNPLGLAKAWSVPQAEKPNISHKQEPTHNEEKIALVLFLASGFAIWNIFQ